jgi:hypothetical protein
METEEQRQWREDARLLGEIGTLLMSVNLPHVQVRLPKPLADQAVAAWKRSYEGGLDPETYEQRAQRHRAGDLGLIGLAITEHGKLEGDEVVVDLDAGLIRVAIDASDDLPSE